MNRLKKIIGFSILWAYIIAMTSFVNVAYNKSYCGAVDIVVQDSLETRFVQRSDVAHILKEKGFDVLAQLPSDIKLYEIEEAIQSHASIKTCNCYFLANNTLKIEVSQRHPIARIFTDRDDYYIDEQGAKMPPSPFYTAHVPIITGYVDTALVSTDLFRIASAISSDPFWEAQIEQIDVEANGEYVLIPRAGRQRIELGSADNLELKFKSLKALYLQVFNNNAWNKYKTISLKYDGQVVCTKK